MAELNKKIGEMNFDGLISDINPPVQVRGRVLAKLGTETVYKRGTLLSVGDDGKCVILGTDGTTPDCVLCDDTAVGTAEDAPVAVYTAGCFDFGKVTVKDGYTLTEADKDELRKRSIVFKAVSAAR